MMSHHDQKADEYLYLSSDDIWQSKKEIVADQLKLGISYFNAYHIEDNCSIAFRLIKLSAEQGNMEAQFKLAELYSLGQGTSKSHTDAYKWYTKAAIQGYKKASIRIHNLYQEDIKMHCRGKLDSKEELRIKFSNDVNDDSGVYGHDEDDKYYRKTAIYYYRELNEQRLDDHKLVLNHVIDYYTVQFKKYRSSNKKDAEIQQNLGFLYQHGYGVKKYDKWAIEYYTKAAENGYVDSQYQLGCLHQKNTNIKFNYKKAFFWYNLAANGGNVAAQNSLAYFYEKGLGTDIDYQQALYWYTKAARSGHSGAQLTLGKWYRKGDYVSQSYETAIKWYSLAARQGSKVAQNCLAQLYLNGKFFNSYHEKDIFDYCKEGSMKGRLCSKLQMDILKINNQKLAEKTKTLAKRALIGDGNAMYQIGLKYYHGNDFDEDKHVGFKWIKKAAEAGHTNAVFKITRMYERGDTVQEDFHKTATWIKKGVKQKNDVAQCNLGILYHEGRGVRHDPLEASKWFTYSANQGNREALYQLGRLKQRGGGAGVYRNQEEALESFNLLTKQGDANGCYKVGMNYYYRKLGKYRTTGYKLLEHSARQGHEYAQYQLWYIHIDDDEAKANFYFDMLVHSRNTSIISRMLHYYKPTADYIKRFNLLRRASYLGISNAKARLQIPIYDPLSLYEDDLIDLFTIVSERGVSFMEYNIGYIYEYKKLEEYYNAGLLENYSKAIHWYNISAEKDDSRAQVRLGIICEEGKGVDVDFTEAIKYYNLACEKGNADAMYRLACMYLDGRGTPQDLEKAYKLYTQASDMGHIEARKILMLPYHIQDEKSSEYKYYQQQVVQINRDNQIKMLQLVARSGLVAIQYQLGTFYENKDISKAMIWFTLAAQGGVTDACYKLGVFYEEGRGTKKDYTEVISYYEKAISNEHEDAMYRLAQIYLYGKGIETDYKQAYKLYSRAAKLGHISSCNILGANFPIDEDLSTVHPESKTSRYPFDTASNEFKHSLSMFQYIAKGGEVELQYKLGIIYSSILDTPDYGEAAKWFCIATKNSHAQAMYRLGLLYETGLGVIQDYQKAIDLYSQAYKLGSYIALYKLGDMYHHGIGMDIDPKKAIQCYTESANNGHLESQHMLGQLYEQGILVKKNTLEALRWFTTAYLEGYDPARTDLYKMYVDLPCEDYFFDRRSRILLSATKSVRFLPLEKYRSMYNQEYKEVHGNMVYQLGMQYLCGNGVPQDHEKALEYFNVEDSRFGYSQAWKLVNLEYTGDRDLFYKMLNIYDIYFDILRPHRQYLLAMVYYDGVSTTLKHTMVNQKPVNNTDNSLSLGYTSNKQEIILERNYKKASYYFEKITEGHGHYSEAQEKLAEMYTYGHGADKNIEKAIEHYTRATTKTKKYGFTIAIIYHFNIDFCDSSKAVEWYKRAGESKNAAALNILGILYKLGHYVNQEYKTAIQYFIEASKRWGYDSCCALYNLGLMYYHGKGIKQNYTEAFAYFKKASEKNHEKARIYLVSMYLNGHGTEKNISEAEKWRSKVSTASSTNESIGVANVEYFDGYPEAIEWLKKVEESDPAIYLCDIKATKPRKTITQSIKSSKGESLYSIGNMYYSGRGVQKDYHQAHTYFIEAAEKDNYDAQKTLAKMYEEGLGVNKDIEKAIEWYMKASEDEPSRHAFEIANIYHTSGKFCNYTKALEWYKKVKGDKKACALYNIGILYHRGDGIDHEFDQALHYYKEAAVLGDQKALITLGNIYYYGEDVDQDFEKAYDYFKTASDRNNLLAQEKLAEMYRHGQGVDKNINQAIEWYTKASNNGSDYGTVTLGKLYHSSTEIQDFKKAFEWYQKAQESVKSYALRGIGLLFEYGDHVNQDYGQSVEYYQQSIDLENKGGYYNLALMYYDGKGVEKDHTKCFDLLNECIKKEPISGNNHVFIRIKNNPDISTFRENRIYSLENETTLYGEIYYQLGIMHKNGQGTGRNDEEARSCFLKAIECGNEQAKDQIY